MRKFLFLSNKNSNIWLKEQFYMNHRIFRRTTKFLQNFLSSIAFRVAKKLGLGIIESINYMSDYVRLNSLQLIICLFDKNLMEKKYGRAEDFTIISNSETNILLFFLEL